MTDFIDQIEHILSEGERHELKPRDILAAIAAATADARQPEPDLSEREYVVGLPVCVTIKDSGWVHVEVDLSELEVGICKDSNAGPLGEQWDTIDTYETAVADSEVLGRWARVHDVGNEGFAPPADDDTSHTKADVAGELIDRLRDDRRGVLDRLKEED